MMSPYVDFCSDQDTMATMAGVEPLVPAPDLTEDPCMSSTVRAYLGNDTSLVNDPLVSPLRAIFSELYPGGNTLPPTLIQVGLREVLLSQAVLLYHALKAAAPRPGNVVLSPYEAMPHVHQIHFNRLSEARAAQVEMGEFFKRALNKAAVCG
jgi:acetyl esterase/lipase